MEEDLKVNHIDGGIFTIPNQFVKYCQCYVAQEGYTVFECNSSRSHIKMPITTEEAIRIQKIQNDI